MGVDIGGNTITQAGAVLTVNTGDVMQLLSAGGVVRPAQTQFVALGNQAAAWVNFTQGAWNKIPFPTASRNDNACFDHTNSRFVAPVGGWYFFQAGVYLLKDGASVSYYWHPAFYVNGTGGGQVVNTAYPNYRIAGHGYAPAGYGVGQITQCYALSAGDYVEYYMYSTGSPTNRFYPPYSRFTGFLLG